MTVDRERPVPVTYIRGWALIEAPGQEKVTNSRVALVHDKTADCKEKMRVGGRGRGWGNGKGGAEREGSISLYTQRLHNQIDNAFSFCPLSSIELKLLGTPRCYNLQFTNYVDYYG